MKSEPAKILIIRLSSIGDILLTTPFLRQTRNTFPKAQIDYVIKSQYADLLKYNNNISNLIEYDTESGFEGLRDLKNRLINQNYSIIFDLHKNFRSIYLRLGHQKIKVYSIKKNKIIQFLFVKFKLNLYNSVVAIPERYLRAGQKEGILDDGAGLNLYWDEQTKHRVEKILTDCSINKNDSFYCIAPGAGFFTKRWPVEYYKQFIESIIKIYNKKVVILGDKNEKKEGEALSKLDRVVDMTGKLSLLESAVVLAKSEALLSNDSGLMHMATAVKTPVLAIFGSTVKELGFFPYRSKSAVVENNSLSCRPCSHIGRHNCPKSHFKCMKEIYPEIVLEKFAKLLIN